jgi:hypothetical protein
MKSPEVFVHRDTLTQQADQTVHLWHFSACGGKERFQRFLYARARIEARFLIVNIATGDHLLCCQQVAFGEKQHPLIEWWRY